MCDRGSLTEQAPKTFQEDTLLELLNVLYVEDGAFPLEDREQLPEGVQMISDHFKRFGLDAYQEREENFEDGVCLLPTAWLLLA